MGRSPHTQKTTPDPWVHHTHGPECRQHCTRKQAAQTFKAIGAGRWLGAVEAYSAPSAGQPSASASSAVHHETWTARSVGRGEAQHAHSAERAGQPPRRRACVRTRGQLVSAAPTDSDRVHLDLVGRAVTQARALRAHHAGGDARARSRTVVTPTAPDRPPLRSAPHRRSGSGD
jgi:hypothetical protein